MRNLQEQVKKAFCYQKFFRPFTVWINCSSDLKFFANFKSFSLSLEQFFFTVGQNKFGNKIPELALKWDLVIQLSQVILKKISKCVHKMKNYLKWHIKILKTLYNSEEQWYYCRKKTRKRKTALNDLPPSASRWVNCFWELNIGQRRRKVQKSGGWATTNRLSITASALFSISTKWGWGWGGGLASLAPLIPVSLFGKKKKLEHTILATIRIVCNDRKSSQEWKKHLHFIVDTIAIKQSHCTTVEFRFKKALFKKESQFKKDCCYNRFFST